MRVMTTRINLADPDFEPTDEQLQELSRKSFAHVAEANRASLRRLREDIARMRTEVGVASQMHAPKSEPH